MSRESELSAKLRVRANPNLLSNRLRDDFVLLVNIVEHAFNHVH